MRVIYDEDADTAYLALDETAKRGQTEAVRAAQVTLDYSQDGRLVGIEVIDASKLLPSDFLTRFANRNAEPS